MLSFCFRIFCWYRGFCHRAGSDLLLFLLINVLNSKLYCRYEYTKPCMNNRIWGLKNYDFRRMDIDFICNGSVDLFGTGRERKIQNENICLQRDSNAHHARQRQESQRLRLLGHEGLVVSSGLMSYRIMGYKFT